MAPRPSSARISYRPKRSALWSSLADIAVPEFHCDLTNLDATFVSRLPARRSDNEYKSMLVAGTRCSAPHQLLIGLPFTPSYRRVTGDRVLFWIRGIKTAQPVVGIVQKQV